MSTYQNLSEKALETIEKGKDDVKGYAVGSQSHLLAIELALWKRSLTKDDRKDLPIKYGVSTNTFKNVLGRMRKLDLWEDATGGLGRTDSVPLIVTKPPEKDGGEDGEDGGKDVNVLKSTVEEDGPQSVTLPEDVLGDNGEDDKGLDPSH